MKRIPLTIKALTPQPHNPNAYHLVLQEMDGNRLLCIAIGVAEAQAIAIQIQGMSTARPLVYDFVSQLTKEFNIKILEIEIYKIESGIYHSKVMCESKTHPFKTAIDARTSDAVAMALKSRCPIYTTEDVMREAGQECDLNVKKKVPSILPLSSMTTAELKTMLRHAINREDYEQATKIRDEINRR